MLDAVIISLFEGPLYRHRIFERACVESPNETNVLSLENRLGTPVYKQQQEGPQFLVRWT
jgi:hypothetical protein